MWARIRDRYLATDLEIWDAPCHGTVDWDELDCDLFQRSRRGTWEMVLSRMAEAAVGSAAGSMAGAPVIQYLRRVHGFGDEERPDDGEDDRQPRAEADNDGDVQTFLRFARSRQLDQSGQYTTVDVGETLEEKENVDGDMYVSFLEDLEALRATGTGMDELVESVVPFSANAEFVLGPRYDWVADGAVSLRDLAVTVRLIEFFLEANIHLTGEPPTDVRRLAVEPEIDYSRNVISVGGPVPNWYTRNVMYGDEVDVPYRFNLNPGPAQKDLRDYTPGELRSVGHRDTEPFEEVPDWYIADGRGDPVVVDGEPARPTSRPSLARDYFTIVKAPNVHRRADPADKQCLILAGCHGLGTMASAKALESPRFLEEIHSQVGGEPFQAIGRVTVTEESSEISVPVVEPIA